MKYRLLQTFRKKMRRIIGRRRERCILDYGSAQRYVANGPYRLFLTAINIPAALISSFRLVVPYVEMDITSRCNLNCKECSHLIPLHKKMKQARDYDVEELINNIDLLVDKIDQCLIFRVLGGEPFLHKQMHLVIRRLISEPKVKHVQVVTNGTIIPTGENLVSLKHKKVSVEISNYGDLSSKKDELVKTMEENDIPVKLDAFNPVWYETNGLVPRDYTAEKMKSVFFNCSGANCKNLQNGKLWLCPPALHGTTLGLVPENKKEYIDLRTCSKKEFWEKLDGLYSNPDGLSTCYYCMGGSMETAKQVPCAEQA